MKKLSQVTMEDAKAILYDAYGQFWITKPDKWKLEDRTAEIKEPCKFLFARDKIWQFWFFDDKIDIEAVKNDDAPMEIVGIEDLCDVKLSCYLKAHELGYEVPGLSDKINSIESKVKELEDTLGGVVVESSGMYLTKTIDVTENVIDNLEQNVSDLEVLLARLFGAYVINIDEDGFPKASLQELLDLHEEVSHMIKTGNVKKT